MENNFTEAWKQYQDGLSYLSKCGLANEIPTCVKFYEGDQWPAATERTKNMPRAMVNIVKMICRSKRAAILSTPVRILYKGEYQDEQRVQKYNNFASYIQKEIKQDEADKKAVYDATIKGTYVYHYYWDSEARGKNGVKKGGVRVENIDMMNVFFADPTQVDEQKQKWIIIASREDVASVRAKADDDVDESAIVADEMVNNPYGRKEQDGSELCTVLTKYFRKDGEVYIEKSTQTCVVNKAFPLAPPVQEFAQQIAMKMPAAPWEMPDGEISEDAKAEFKPAKDEAFGAVDAGKGKRFGKKPENPWDKRGGEEDAAEGVTPDNTEEGKQTNESVRAGLYPIVVGQYEPKQDRIYGIGEAVGCLYNQKIINHTLSMQALNIQENAWGKWIVTDTALGNQKITNLPGQVLVDHSGTGNGIRRMTEQAMNMTSVNFSDNIMSLTRSVTGATEVMSGEVIGANMSGAAIASLQAQANVPIEELRDSYWRVKVKQGKVLSQFYKLFYENTEFVFVDKQIGDAPQNDVFNGSEYADDEFDVTVEVTGSSKSSVASDIAELDALYTKGAIDLDTYIGCYPDEMMSNKQMILDGIERSKQSQMAQMQGQMEQMQGQLNEAVQIIQEQNDTVANVESIISENKKLKELLANLYNESKAKIDEANRQISIANGQIQKGAEAAQDAEMFAKEIQRRDGMSPENSNLNG